MATNNQVIHHGHIVGMRNNDTCEFMAEGWLNDFPKSMEPFTKWYRVTPAQKENAEYAFRKKLHVLITIEIGAINNIQKIVDF